MDISNYAQYKETNILKHNSFAFNIYLCTIPLDFERVALHWHDEIEIIYIKKGCAKVTLGLLSFQAAAGSIVTALSGDLHAIEREGDESLEYENIIFSPSLLESADADWSRKCFYEPLRLGQLHLPNVLSPGTRLHEEATPLLATIDAASERREEGYPLQIRGCLFLFFHLLYTARRETVQQETDLREAEKVKDAISFIREHYAEPIKLSEAAEVTGYSVPHFSRFFKKYTGQSFVEYLTGYRLTAAAQLLSQSDQSISDISQMTGFDNFSYFCRLFKKKYRITPRRYRVETRTSEG